LKDVNGFEELMQRMRRVGKAEMRQGIGDQEMAEVVRSAGSGHGKVRQQREPEYDRQNRQQQHTEVRAFGETSKMRGDHRPGEIEQHQKSREQQFDVIGGAETQRIVERKKGTKDLHR
jgi:hypothetical protein